MARRSLVLARGLLAVCVAGAAALLHAQAQAQASAQASAQAQAQASSPSSQPATPASAEGDRQLVQTMCSACHDIGQVTSKTMTADDWAATVDKMIGLGAPVSEEDRQRIITYLAAHQAPPKP